MNRFKCGFSRTRFTAVLCASAVATTACSNDFEPPSKLDRLRILSVRSEPGSGVPGAETSLEMLLVDEDEAPDLAAARALDVLWLGGCHNPPGRQFYGCYPTLRRIVAALDDRAADTDPNTLPAGVFGTGRTFAFTVPDDILEQAPRIESDPIHFGVSFVFFAACSGTIVPRPDSSDRVPLGCVDRQSGAPVPPAGFVTGFSTVFTYEGLTNENPRLEGVAIDGVPYAASMPCESDAECVAFEGTTCSAAKACVPALEACPEKGDCRARRIEPLVDPASAEQLGDGHEIVWANYYATAGAFDSDTQLVSDRATGLTDDPSSLWTPPRHAVDTVRLWITLNDQRGGATWTALDVAVREAAPSQQEQ